MSTVKISQLVEVNHLNIDTSNTIFVGVDLPSGVTGKFTATTIAEGLYSHNPLKVGNNEILFDHTIGQYSGTDDTYLQLNLQNFSGDGSGDYVITANNGTNSNSYIDLGLNGSSYSDVEFNSMDAYDGYLYVSGPSEFGAKGNLVIGTASSNTRTLLICGGTTANDIIAYVTKTGLQLNTDRSLTFEDGSIQYVAAAPEAHTQAAFNLANTVNAYSYSANTWLRANDGITLVTAKSYTDTTETALRANDGITLVTAKSYTDSANTWLKNYVQTNYLANTSGVFNGSLQFTGSVTTSGNVNTTSVHMSDELLFSSSGVIRTPSGINNSKNMSLSSGNDLGGYPGGSISITAGNSTATNGLGGNITLTPGTGNVIDGKVEVAGKLSVQKLIELKNANVTDNSIFLLITGAANNAYQPPSNPGYTIHTTSIDGQGNRVVADAFGSAANNYASFIGRRGRGTAQSPTAVQSGDVIARFGGNGFGSTKFSQYGDGRIEVVAAENFTDASKRTKLEFFTTESGSNTANVIATFNGNSAEFTGVVNPQKGFVYTPNVISGSTTTLNIDIANNSLYKCSSSTGLTVNLSGFQYGKVVELWFVNTGGSTQTVTHGCYANNSTINSTSFSMPASSSAYLRYFSIDGDLANTYVAIQHA